MVKTVSVNTESVNTSGDKKSFMTVNYIFILGPKMSVCGLNIESFNDSTSGDMVLGLCCCKEKITSCFLFRLVQTRLGDVVSQCDSSTASSINSVLELCAHGLIDTMESPQSPSMQVSYLAACQNELN